jgi:2-amino-4-hydroxy-6-hydroxymethyldihydropteridine diphosphokinase
MAPAPGGDIVIDAYIGIGSNLGDRLANVAAGVTALSELPDTNVQAVSHAYESEPWGAEGQPPYVNAVVHIRTDLYADQLLALLKDDEEQLGRVPAERFGPRVIDLDILLFGDEEWASEDITIPHPRMAERAFVIRPLLEIAPDVRYPNEDPVTDANVSVGRITADLGAVPGWEAATPRQQQGAATAEEPRETCADDLGRAAGSGPELEGEWVPLGVSRLDGVASSVSELIYLESVLNDAGIPSEFFPHRPNEASFNPYGIREMIGVYVPASRLAEAREIARDVLGELPSAE